MTDKSLERKYDEVFNSVCDYVDRQKETDPSFSLNHLQKMLETEYINEGNGWVGKSEVQETVSAATIAAYQHKIVEWKKETKQNK